MSNSSIKIPVGIKPMAQMMAMEETEVRFFPKIEDLRGLLKDYNYGMLTRQQLVAKLEAMQSECSANGMTAYAGGIEKLVKSVQYRY